jgi:ABC-type Fe3+-siderophore transport system permease subunit
MYVSGAIVGFILAFFVFMFQGIKRKQESNESMISVIIGALFGSVLAAFLSWLSVILLALLFFSGNIKGISEK